MLRNDASVLADRYLDRRCNKAKPLRFFGRKPVIQFDTLAFEVAKIVNAFVRAPRYSSSALAFGKAHPQPESAATAIPTSKLSCVYFVP